MIDEEGIICSSKCMSIKLLGMFRDSEEVEEEENLDGKVLQ